MPMTLLRTVLIGRGPVSISTTSTPCRNCSAAEVSAPAHDAWLAADLLAVDAAGLGGLAWRGTGATVPEAWLARLRRGLPEGAPLRRLPLHADDDRLLGGLDLAATLAAWPLMGLLLKHATDSDVPFLDALPTVGSLTGQILLGRKLVDNWAVWLAVNVVSVGLFAVKGLWLTVLLYALFAALSVVGWRAWQRLATNPAGPARG